MMLDLAGVGTAKSPKALMLLMWSQSSGRADRSRSSLMSPAIDVVARRGVDMSAIDATERSNDRSLAASCAVLGAAVGVFGIAFGVGSVAAGGSVAMTCVMSLLVFTGASQFSAVSVIASGGSTAAALAGASLLAARNGVYGLAMSRTLRGSLLKRIIAAQITIDESTAMSTAKKSLGPARVAFWWTGLSVYVFWNAGTLSERLQEMRSTRKVWPRRSIPCRIRGDGHSSSSTPERSTCRCDRAVICAVTIPFMPAGVPILCASVGVVVGVKRP